MGSAPSNSTPTMSKAQPNFSSDGFDLDAMAAAEGGEGETVFEIGGSATTVPSAPNAGASSDAAADAGPATAAAEPDLEPDPLAQSIAAKAEGNQSFKAGSYLDAYDSYTDAIEACPGSPTGRELLRLREEFEEAERGRVAELHQAEMERRRRKDAEAAEKRRQQRSRTGAEDDKEASSAKAEDESEGGDEPPAPSFDPPQHPHAAALAVYHANRAACSLHLSRPAECVEDCTIAIMLHPKYVKAYLRRAAAHEVLEETEDALRDAKTALEVDPRNAAARREVSRLQKIEDERLEKLKEETMGKLKDLGNSILGNFGMSLDNFKTVKDPATGSYSISFDQGAGK